MTQLDEGTLDTMNKLTNQTTLDDPSQNATSNDDIGEIDYEARESGGGGTYTPRVYPGIYPFLFALEDANPFELREYTIKKTGEQVKDFTINHKGTVSITDSDGTPQEVVIRFNQAGFHQFANRDGKKFNSRGAELLRSLAIPPDATGGNKLMRPLVEQALQHADGNTMGRGMVNWEAYCKDCKLTVSTSGRKNQSRWPKGADGKYVTEVACPKCGVALAGRERITDYKLPQA